MTVRGKPGEEISVSVCGVYLLAWTRVALLTPAQHHVPGQVFPQREERAAHQGEEEVALGQQPGVVGHDGVVGQHQHHLTCYLPNRTAALTC